MGQTRLCIEYIELAKLLAFMMMTEVVWLLKFSDYTFSITVS